MAVQAGGEIITASAPSQLAFLVVTCAASLASEGVGRHWAAL